MLLRTRLGAEGPKEGSTLATVKGIMSTEILAVAPDSTIAETATVMGTRGVGSALVMEGDELVGIFTERDALRAVASDFGAAQHPVTQFMTRAPTTTSPDTTTREALDIMLKQGFRHLPVIEGERVIGMVSLRDLTASLERELGDE